MFSNFVLTFYDPSVIMMSFLCAIKRRPRLHFSARLEPFHSSAVVRKIAASF